MTVFPSWSRVARRRAKLKMRYRHRLDEEIASTREKLTLLLEIKMMGFTVPDQKSSPAWTAEENLIVSSTVSGSLSILDMIDMLYPKRPYHAIRKRYAAHGSPDEETRFRRATEFGSVAYARACAETGKSWK